MFFNLSRSKFAFTGQQSSTSSMLPLCKYTRVMHPPLHIFLNSQLLKQGLKGIET